MFLGSNLLKSWNSFVQGFFFHLCLLCYGWVHVQVGRLLGRQRGLDCLYQSQINSRIVLCHLILLPQTRMTVPTLLSIHLSKSYLCKRNDEKCNGFKFSIFFFHFFHCFFSLLETANGTKVTNWSCLRVRYWRSRQTDQQAEKSERRLRWIPKTSKVKKIRGDSTHECL